MADTSGQELIRGIDINKLAIAYEDEALIFKKAFCNVSTTSAREIRWYQKTAGFLSATSPAVINNVAELALPFVLEQSWTRQTSYVRKYFVESPIISQEDIRDCDVDVLAGNMRDLTQSIAYQEDSRIWDVATESRVPSLINSNITAAAWDTPSYTAVNIVEDLMEAKQNIRVNSGFSPEGAILLLSPKDHRSMMNWLIDSKGSSIPSFASQRIQDGVVMEILGLKVIVSNNVTASYAAVIIPDKAVTWKEFTPITAVKIEEPGIGTKIRVWEEGEAILERPKCVNLIYDTQT